MKKRSVVVLLSALTLLVIGAAAALAADGNKQVGLVIAFPDGTKHAEIVTVPITATTYEALQKANIELVGSVGQFGPAVCSINGTGCPASNCFCDSKHFWAFYHLDKASNTWTAAQEGVGQAVPADGSVEGLAWSEMDAQFNPVTRPPVMTFAQIQGGGAAATAAQPAATLPVTGSSIALWLMAVAVGLVVAGVLINRSANRRV